MDNLVPWTHGTEKSWVGPEPWLGAPWDWCHAAREEIVCEKSLEGDAGPWLPCRAAEGAGRYKEIRSILPIPACVD